MTESSQPWKMISTGTATHAKAATDTFYLYGGPDTVEGRFQTELGGGAPDAQGWTGWDDTEQENHWHVSTTNATNPATTAIAFTANRSRSLIVCPLGWRRL